MDNELMFGIVGMGVMFIWCLFPIAIVVGIVKSSKAKKNKKKIKKELKRMYDDGKITKDQYFQFVRLNEAQNEIQRQQFLNNLQEFQQMQFDNQEMARLMSTGIEFGGFNSDLGLNPTAMNQHFNEMNQMNDFNNNNFGNNGMF